MLHRMSVPVDHELGVVFHGAPEDGGPVFTVKFEDAIEPTPVV